MRPDEVPDEAEIARAEIARAIDRLLADADEGALPPVDTIPPRPSALDVPVNPPWRIA